MSDIPKDRTFSKMMEREYPKFYYGMRLPTGVGGELRSLRSLVDGVALRHEAATDRGYPLFLDVNQVHVTSGLSAAKIYHAGIPTGYEKATYGAVYTVGKTVTITAVKPGELGNKITVAWSDTMGAASVSKVGTAVAIVVKADGSTTPAALTALINADPNLKGLIVLTSTDNTAIPPASAIIGTTWTLAGGTGRGWGYCLVGAWGATTSAVFVAKTPGLGYDYSITWAAGAAASVVATRQGITLTYVNATTTYAAMMALVRADVVAMRHLSMAAATGTGGGTITGLDGQTMYLTEDMGTALFVGAQMATITSVASTYVQFDLAALSYSVNGMLGVTLRLGMGIAGETSILTDFTDTQVKVTEVDFGVAAPPYTVLSTDEIIEITTGALSGDVDLPTAASSDGRHITIKKVDAGVGVVSVDPNGAEVIEGLGAGVAYQLRAQFDTVTIYSNGTQWYVKSPTKVADVTPTAVDFGVTAPYAILPTDEVIEVTTGAVDSDTDLPLASGFPGRRITVKKVDAGVGVVSVDPDATESIEGWGVGVAFALRAQFDAITLQSNGTQWYILSTMPPQRYAPTAVDFGVTAPYPVLETDKVIEVTTGAVADDVDLPSAVGIAGRVITVKKVDAGVGTVSVDPDGVEVIEALGAGAAYVLTNQGESVTLQSNGVQWYILHTTIAPAVHANTHRNAGADPFRLSITTPPAGAYAILTTDEYVRCNSGGAGAVAATLYVADAAAVGRVVRVQKIDAAADDVNVTPNGAETINGVAAFYALAAQWNSVTLLCVAVGQWEIIVIT